MRDIALIYFPWKSNAPYKFISDVLKILDPISNNITLIGGNPERILFNRKRVNIVDIRIRMHDLIDHPIIFSVILWIIKCVLVQLKISIAILKERKKIDVLIFYTAYPYYLLPLIMSKFLNKKTIEIVTRGKPRSFSTKLMRLQDQVLFRLLDGISPESEFLIKELRLEKYKNKILPEGFRFIDTDHYKMIKKLNERNNVVGFIGRIIKDKGIVEFVKTIPIVINDNEDILFLIGGSGNMLSWVEKECKKIKTVHNNIIITGWIGDDLPSYLNELKLLVHPSYNDGLPTIILEAMSCCTPVLATPVGAVPDLIKDNNTGFVIENNSPEYIKKYILSSLACKNIDKITKNAQELIEKKYTYNAAVSRYKEMIIRVSEV